jgi:hypothetical protein
MIVTRLYRRGKHKHSALAFQNRHTDVSQAYDFQGFFCLPDLP